MEQNIKCNTSLGRNDNGFLIPILLSIFFSFSHKQLKFVQGQQKIKKKLNIKIRKSSKFLTHNNFIKSFSFTPIDDRMRNQNPYNTAHFFVCVINAWKLCFVRVFCLLACLRYFSLLLAATHFHTLIASILSNFVNHLTYSFQFTFKSKTIKKIQIKFSFSSL